MHRIVETVRPKLVADGMFLVGIDIVGDKLMEINVFSVRAVSDRPTNSPASSSRSPSSKTWSAKYSTKKNTRTKCPTKRWRRCEKCRRYAVNCRLVNPARRSGLARRWVLPALTDARGSPGSVQLFNPYNGRRNLSNSGQRKTKMKPLNSWRYALLLPAFACAFACAIAALSGCGGGSGTSLPPPTPTTLDAQTSQIAQWQPIVSGAVAAVPAPPFAGAGAEQNEIAQLLKLQSARTGTQTAIFNKWNDRAATQWNRIARDLVIANDTVPPRAARVYAALSVAQLDATIAAARAGRDFSRATPAQTSAQIQPLSVNSDGYPARTAALCRASADVLKSIYPGNTTQIEAAQSECAQSRLVGGVSFPSDIEAGAQVGDDIAAKVLARISSDNADKAEAPQPKPAGPGVWPGDNGLLPSWKLVRPWLTDDITKFRAAAPPASGSPEFNRDLTEVRQISDNRTLEQSQIADFWADAGQTFTPPGHWNLFADRIIQSHNLSDAQAARVYALLNLAQQDAGIACWDAKYSYWVLRPSQADPNITTPVGLPNFPSYVSGHSTFRARRRRFWVRFFPTKNRRLTPWRKKPRFRASMAAFTIASTPITASPSGVASPI